MTHFDPSEDLLESDSDLDPSPVDALEQKLQILLTDQGILDNLTPEQVRALIPIARGDTIAEVAAAVGRGDKTIKRWLKEEAFKTAVSATISCIYTYGLRTCAVVSVEAIEVLRTAINDRSCKMSDRLKAASIVLELGDRWQNLRLEEKITELERRLAMRTGDDPSEEDDEDE